MTENSPDEATNKIETFRFASRFKCGETECVWLRKDGRPLLVELPYIDTALMNGAENLPEYCSGTECWVEMNYEDLDTLENEMEWVFGW